jgi:hypothetical protein
MLKFYFCKIKDSLSLKQLEERIIDFSIKVIKDNDALFIEQNIEQLRASKRADGSNIEPLYAEYTKKKKGFEKPDLKDTSEFYDNFAVEVNREMIEIRSSRFERGFDVRAQIAEDRINKVAKTLF